MSEPFRVGFVGTGGISRGHAVRFQAREDTTIVAACDMRQDAVQKFAGEFGVERTYNSCRDMLAQESLDILCVCTWPDTHAEMTVAGARAGVKGVLCEKPMCIDLAQADTMIMACKKAGAKLIFSHQRRYQPVLSEARRLIAEGAIGQPTMLKRNAGGGLTNTHTHTVDFFRYLLGDPPVLWVMGQVQRQSDRWERHSPIEDLCLCYVCFENGVRAVIGSDMPASAAPENSYVYGMEGMMEVGREQVRVLDPKSAEWRESQVDGPDERTAQIQEFIEYVKGEREDHRCDAVHARAAMEIMLATYESARTRSLVYLPLETHASPLEKMIADGDRPGPPGGSAR